MRFALLDRTTLPPSRSLLTQRSGWRTKRRHAAAGDLRAGNCHVIRLFWPQYLRLYSRICCLLLQLITYLHLLSLLFALVWNLVCWRPPIFFSLFSLSIDMVKKKLLCWIFCLRVGTFPSCGTIISYLARLPAVVEVIAHWCFGRGEYSCSFVLFCCESIYLSCSKRNPETWLFLGQISSLSRACCLFLFFYPYCPLTLVSLPWRIAIVPRAARTAPTASFGNV